MSENLRCRKHPTQEYPMSLRTNIPDPDDMNLQRALWAKAALREFAIQVSGPQALSDMRELDNVAASLLCDLAHLADERGWKLVDLLRVARARYNLETESRGEQFDGFEDLVPPRYESPRKPAQYAEIDEAEDERQASCEGGETIVTSAMISNMDDTAPPLRRC
jgi:hypothetical protein